MSRVTSRSNPSPILARAAAGVLVALLLASCVPPPSDSPTATWPAEDATATPAPDAGRDGGPAPEVEVVDGGLALVDGERAQPLPTPDDDEVVGVMVRPVPSASDGRSHTVLFVARVRELSGVRYEVGYQHLTPSSDATAGWTASDAFRFPGRLQIDPGTAAIVDEPIVALWAPDGTSVAWIEWDRAGVWLQFVGWIDDEQTRNPSERTWRYSLAEVPPGARLVSFDHVGDAALLVAEHDGTRYRVELPGPSPDGAMAAQFAGGA